ncbi:MAG TPA: protein kinase, partial [Urbifossiella sp.]|nr:protein kinase [Urbifossiella sp.]
MESPDRTQVNSDHRGRPAVRADEFRAALARDGVADWEPFLTELTGPARAAVLTEFVAIDLDYRWIRGERVRLESYLERFPEIGPLDLLPVALIREEVRCRVQAGERPNPDDYHARFPTQFHALADVLDPESGATRTINRTTASAPPPRESPPSGSFPTEAIVSVAHQYELVRQLGRGTFGEVWLARKNPSGIEKAVKVLHQPADQETAQRELRSLELIKNLRHPYLLATEDFWVGSNKLYVVTELADGSLR